MRKGRIFSKRLMCLVAAAAVLAGVFSTIPAHSQTQTKGSIIKSPQSNMQIVVKGPVQAVWPDSRRIKVDGVTYILSNTLIVRNKKGEILPKYKIGYFAWAHMVQFTPANYVIQDITILENAS